ncbi:hypothetical protein Tco_1569557 [Tanacetum coccineum]
MDSPPQSPNHVFNFPENEEEFEEDPQEDPEEEMEEWDDMDIIEEEEEDPEEDPEEWDDVEAVEQVDEIPHPVTPPRNPTAVPHSSPEQSSESEDNDNLKLCISECNETIIMPPLRRHGALRPRGSRHAAMERIIADRVAQAIEEHEKKRVSSSNSEGSLMVLSKLNGSLQPIKDDSQDV